jgi:hypothetical protein
MICPRPPTAATARWTASAHAWHCRWPNPWAARAAACWGTSLPPGLGTSGTSLEIGAARPMAPPPLSPASPVAAPRRASAWTTILTVRVVTAPGPAVPEALAVPGDPPARLIGPPDADRIGRRSGFPDPPRSAVSRGQLRVHGPRVTMVHQRKGRAASESIQLPDGQRQHRRMRRCARTEAGKDCLNSVAIGREDRAEDGGHVDTTMSCAQVLNRGVRGPADTLTRRSDER